jgi:PAS domain S-box-containing protein
MDTSSEAGLFGPDGMLMAVLESVGQGVLTVDRGGAIRDCNRRALEMFGYTREELVGQQIEILIPSTLRSAHAAHREDYFKHPRQRTMGQGLELKASRRDQSEFPVEISLSYVERAKQVVAIALISDISVRKMLEAKLLESERLEAMAAVACGAAHDFNNSLTVIGGYNELLLDRLPAGDVNHDYAREIRRACMQATQLAQQLMSFSRRPTVVDRLVSVGAVASEISAILHLLLPPQIRMDVRVEPAAGLVQADPVQLEQVFVNLLMNARDALPNGGRIEIEVRSVAIDEQSDSLNAGHYAMIRISDNGTGMDEETRRRMFEPFFTTKPKGRGNGLGLASVIGTVKKAGGSIQVDSEPGRGTRVEIYLPLIQREDLALGK